MREQEQPGPAGSEAGDAQLDTDDLLNAAQRYRAKRESLEGSGPNSGAMVSDATERRRRLLERIMEDGARIADLAAASPQPGQSDIASLLQVQRLQNVLNQQVYGMCVGLLDSSLAATRAPAPSREQKASERGPEVEDSAIKSPRNQASPGARASSRERRVTYSKLSPKSSARHAPSSAVLPPGTVPEEPLKSVAWADKRGEGSGVDAVEKE